MALAFPYIEEPKVGLHLQVKKPVTVARLCLIGPPATRLPKQVKIKYELLLKNPCMTLATRIFTFDRFSNFFIKWDSTICFKCSSSLSIDDRELKAASSSSSEP